MSKKLLEFNIPYPLPEDYDPILGRSVGEIRNINSSAPVIATPNNDNLKTSVFDDPELDFAYQSPVQEELHQSNSEDVAIIQDEEKAEVDEPSLVSKEDFIEANHDNVETTEALTQSEILSDDVELDPEITPFETMDGAANEAINQAEEENNLSERWRLVDDEILEEQKEEIIATASETITETTSEAEPDKDIATPSEAIDAETEDMINESSASETIIIDGEDVVEDAKSTEISETIEVNEPQETVALVDDIIKPITEEINTDEEQAVEASTSEPLDEYTTELFNEPILTPPPQSKKRKTNGKKRRKAKRTNEFALMGGVFFSGMAILLLVSTLAAPLGRPFSDIASYGIIWSGFALIGAIIWGFLRNWQMTIASLLCLLGFVANIVPTLGDAPIGGKGDANVIGWANVENSPKALQSFVAQGEKNGATLLIIAGANKLIAGDIPNWSVIQVPIANDATSLAVLAKDNWRAVTLPGEPTMARPMDNSLTVIGVNPSLGVPKENAIINRAANRMGEQETAVLTVGDFGLVPWDRTMKDFAKTSGARRVRCGGIFGTTYNNGGLLNTATDHAFGFNTKIQSCEIGDSLPQSHHRPLFVKVLKH